MLCLVFVTSNCRTHTNTSRRSDMSLYACVVIQPQGAPCVARLVMQASPTSAPSCAVDVDHKKTKRKRFRARKTPDEMRKHALHALERCVLSRFFRSSLKSSTSRSPSPAPRCSFLLQTRARAVYRCCMRGLVERYQRFHQNFRCRVCQFTKVLNGARQFFDSVGCGANSLLIPLDL